ncbi:glutamine amidotransferase [Granulicella sp. dw_53]|uniref:glutamine amidotransferase n=1 Tax=Granulicella sp. dw_53 TaxID=2719792 RepID=UPI0021045E90|nr:glutamine amidotransferase [Granulicella sp. dw_53]
MKGRFVLLGRWPGWVLVLLAVLSAGGLGWLMWSRRAEAAPKLRGWRGGVVWGLESVLIALVLLLLWEPAMTVAELSSQQNIIAVLVDDSRSMGIADSGGDGRQTREASAVKALQDGVLAGLQKRFQTRVYRLDAKAMQAKDLGEIRADGAATHISDGLKQLAAETSDLPVGAVVLLTDGAENSEGGVGRETMNALRNRRWPVHTVGFGKERAAHDVEVDDVSVASRAMADSRMVATVRFHQRGYAGGKATLVVRDAGKPMLSREVTLAPDGAMQTETLFFHAGSAGAKSFEFGLMPLAGEENVKNNAVTRPVTVSDEKRRILYVEGEPRWEYKFIRRAEDDDKTVQVVSMLRTTENKIYRQGINDPKELESGFPVRPEDLFQYQGIIIGSVEAGYFTPSQQELLREFVDRRGGGVLFLGGRFSLADGGWGGSSVAELLPTSLPAGRSTFHRDPATAELTTSGGDSPVTRLVDDPLKNVERWKKLTYMMDYQEAGTPKAGATVLADLKVGQRKLPLLITQSYGRGRTALMATSGTWRWQMSEALGDTAHDLFWQQLLRWVVGDTPGRVVAGSSAETLTDDGRIRLTASVRGQDFLPAADAKVEAHVIGPQGLSTTVEMVPAGDVPGNFVADWTAEKSGAYLAEITAEGTGPLKDLGRDVVSFQRTDGVAENFHTEQNREMLEKLSAETGGRYWRPEDLSRLPREISYSEAGVSVRDTKELWNMPVVFLLLVGLVVTEWLLRRKWGVV